MAPSPVPTGRPITLRQEWLFLAVVGPILAAFVVADALAFPNEFEKGKHTPLSVIGGIAATVAQGVWITMDRRRRGREVGWWRFGSIFLGPLAVWLYLILEYRGRALYLIPLSIAVYVAILGLPALAAAFL